MQNGNIWIQSFGVAEDPVLRMFCFPHAGAGAQSFRTWPKQLPKGVELLAIRLPGRETRMRETPISDVRTLLDAMLPALGPCFDKPFILFGHSLGALIAYETARRLQQECGQTPMRLIVSGRVAPHHGTLRAPINALPTPEFIEGLRRLGGTPDAVLNERDLMTQIEPMIRADLAMHENYAYRQGERLQCDILSFGGLRDTEATRDKLNAWREMTTGAFGLRMVPGDHFYIQSAESVFLRLLSIELYQVISAMRSEGVPAGARG